MPRSFSESLYESLRRRAGDAAVHGLFRGLAAAGRLHPLARPERHGVERIVDLAYHRDGSAEHRLDLYRPLNHAGPLPVVVYIHGGGFRILSKDTHWIFPLMFARRGYLVYNINYRLAPRYPFPAAVSDACAALEWVAARAGVDGGDLSRLVLAGESAGANLATSLTLATTYRRDEPYARRIFDLGLPVRAVLPACGLMQVSDPLRARLGRRPNTFMADRFTEIAEDYLRGSEHSLPDQLALADPLLFLERQVAPERRLPPFFIGVGTADPVLDDSRRLQNALERLGARCEIRTYDREMHGFQAMVFRANAQRYWREAHAFLTAVLA
jgi:acetyl esterase